MILSTNTEKPGEKKPQPYKIYTMPDWLIVIDYWPKIESELVLMTIDKDLLLPYKAGVAWGCFVPKVILKRAPEMENPIGFVGSALRDSKLPKYNWIRKPAEQLFELEEAEMKRINRYHKREYELAIEAMLPPEVGAQLLTPPGIYERFKRLQESRIKAMTTEHNSEGISQ